jgi:DNA-binding NarL/FixJ family response regulator
MHSLANATPLKLTGVSGRRLLTKYEEDVAQLVVEGFSNREAAEKLGLTEHTVSNYLFKIYEELGSRRSLAISAKRTSGTEYIPGSPLTQP